MFWYDGHTVDTSGERAFYSALILFPSLSKWFEVAAVKDDMFHRRQATGFTQKQ